MNPTNPWGKKYEYEGKMVSKWIYSPKFARERERIEGEMEKNFFKFFFSWGALIGKMSAMSSKKVSGKLVIFVNFYEVLLTIVGVPSEAILHNGVVQNGYMCI